MWDFTSPRKTIFGEDALEWFEMELFSNVFIVTDPLMKDLHLEKITKFLPDSKITVFDQITDEPSFETVNAGVKMIQEVKPDALIALGGGSVLDTAKGIFLLYALPDYNLAGLDPFERLNLREKIKCSLITIPTTSGTGADVTWAVVITDKSEKPYRKVALAHRELVADVTILDPILTETLPSHLIAGTGFDAISHCVDGYLSSWQNDFSDSFLRHGFYLLWKNLGTAYDQSKKGKVDVELREKLHNAATMAGWGFGNSQVILSHSLGHSIGAVLHVPHAKCIGASLWYCLQYNKESELERIHDLAVIAGIPGSSKEEIVNKFIVELKNYLIKLGLPVSLQEMGISEEQFTENKDSLIKYAENDSGTLSNPRMIDHSDFVTIFEAFYKGDELYQS